MKFICLIFLCLILTTAHPSFVFADTSSSQVLREEDQQQEHNLLYDKLFTTPHSSTIETPSKPEESKEVPPTKFYIKKIIVEGATIISPRDILTITAKFENRDLTISDIRSLIGQLNTLYTKKGYITSFGYLPPQHLNQGVLLIKMFEGKIGNVIIKGNHYFSTKSLEKHSPLVSGQLLNYYPLKRYVDYLNRNPDRIARASIASGVTPGTSDINVDVKDQLPVHFKYDYDDYGSRYIGHNEYRTTIWDTNLLGLDDTASYGYLTSPDHQLMAWNAGYSLPIGNQNSFNLATQHSTTHLGAELKPLDVYGKSTSYSASWNTSLIQNQTWNAHANLGFAYKNNYDLFLENFFNRGNDRLREVTYGGDINHLDSWGRTYFNAAIISGVPDIFGGLKPKDSNASIIGSGGQFTKATLDLIRLQKLPLDTALLWHTETQQSSATLPSAEQFQAGGITNNRGYPAGDLVGDEGYSSSWNLVIPLYPVPRNWMIPFTKTTIYNGIKFVPFYDWSKVVTFKPGAGVKKDQILRSDGIGLQATLSSNLSWKIEYAWPLSQPASDQKKSRLLMSISVRF